MYLFLTIRVLHVLFAALWLGSVVFTSYLLMPAIDALGADGGKVMAAMNRRGLVPFFASISGVTLLSGIYLFWHFTGGFDPAASGSPAGRVYGTGAALGLIAGIIGGSVVGRSAKKASAIAEQMAALPAGADRSKSVAELAGLRRRMVTYGNVVVLLLVITIALMAIGHYV